MSDKTEGIGQYLSTYQRTETRRLAKVTDDNLMTLARLLGGAIVFENELPVVRVNSGYSFRVGDLIDEEGCPSPAHYDWAFVYTKEMLLQQISDGDLR